MSNQVNEIIPFDGQFGKVRAMNLNGEPWFVGKDVADCLGYAAARNAIATHVDNEDKLTHQISASGQNREMTMVNESGLISLVLGSKLPAAKKFKHWITSEVVPSVLKHGAYMTPAVLAEMMQNPKSLETLVHALITEQAAKEAALKQIEQDKPKVQFYEAVGCVDGTLTLTEMSKLLQNAGISMGVKKFTIWLLTNGYLTLTKEPSQKSLNLGVMTTKEHLHTTNHHGIQPHIYARITGKGQQYFIKKLIDLSSKKHLFEQGNFA